MATTHPTVPDAPVYTCERRPDADYTWWHKTAATAMTPINGPCTIVTKEGPYHLPPGWQGWCAVDPDGDIDLIEASTQAATYEPASGEQDR